MVAGPFTREKVINRPGVGANAPAYLEEIGMGAAWGRRSAPVHRWPRQVQALFGLRLLSRPLLHGQFVRVRGLTAGGILCGAAAGPAGRANVCNQSRAGVWPGPDEKAVRSSAGETPAVPVHRVCSHCKGLACATSAASRKALTPRLRPVYNKSPATFSCGAQRIWRFASPG